MKRQLLLAGVLLSAVYYYAFMDDGSWLIVKLLLGVLLVIWSCIEFVQLVIEDVARPA